MHACICTVYRTRLKLTHKHLRIKNSDMYTHHDVHKQYCHVHAGMAIGGTCPGMVMVQLGAAVPNAQYTFAGGLLGALFYGLLEPTCESNSVHAQGSFIATHFRCAHVNFFVCANLCWHSMRGHGMCILA